MTIDRLGEKTILVTLTDEDMLMYDLDFSADSPSTRRGLTRLMYAVGEECGLSHRGKSYLIEALPGGKSCLLIISVRVNKPRRKYRIKRERCEICCRFDDTDALLDWLDREESRSMSYTLFRSDGAYCLFPEYPPTEAARRVLSEYAAVIGVSPVAAARVREYGEPIAVHSVKHHYFRYPSSAAR